MPLALTCGMLTLGGMLAQPYVQAMVTSFGGERLVGTYLGMYYLAQGTGAALGNLATGAAFDLADRTGFAALPWLAMALVGLASARAVVVLDRRGLLAQPAAAGG